MARPVRNEIRLTPTESGGFFVSGRLFGEQIRRRFRSHEKAEAYRLELENKKFEHEKRTGIKAHAVLTTLRDEEVRELEGFKEWCRTHGTTVLEMLETAKQHPPPTSQLAADEALKRWLSHLKATGRRPRTLEKNGARVEAFLRRLKGSPNVSDITASHVSEHVLRDGIGLLTKVEDGMVLRAFLAFCVSRGWAAKSPFAVDLEGLKAQHRPGRPVILTPEECAALHRTCLLEAPKMLPYLALSMWCFLRSAEAVRTKPEDIHVGSQLPQVPKAYVEVWPVKAGTVSYRHVSVPGIAANYLYGVSGIYYSKRVWLRVRQNAGVLEKWEENILRHTGISYFYQSLAARAEEGTFNERSIIAEVCRQAGNSDETAFRHYLSLPQPGDYENFYSLLRG